MTTEMRTYPVVDSVIDLLADWLRHRRDIAELCDCGAAEHARIAHEIGVSDDVLDDMVRRGPHAADELPKMLEALNLDAHAIARAMPLVMRDLERVCAQCEDKRRCRIDLATGVAPFEYTDYCGNAPTIAALANENAKD